jgi:hypothetical protein
MNARVLILAALVIACAGSLIAQTKEKQKKAPVELPAAVSSAFHKAYPNAKIEGTEKEKEGGKDIYEINSVDGTTKRSVTYTADGKLAEVEEVVNPKDLPADVMKGFRTVVPKGDISMAEKIMKDGKTSYEIKVKTDKKTREIVLDPAGKVIEDSANPSKKEKDEDEDDDDDDDAGR